VPVGRVERLHEVEVGVDRDRVVQLLSGIDHGDALHQTAKLEEMAADIEQITDEESAGLEGESRQARVLDQQLAGDLRHRRIGGQTSSAGYLRELGDRPRLPIGAERRLIEAARGPLSTLRCLLPRIRDRRSWKRTTNGSAANAPFTGHRNLRMAVAV
jgi:hypothetical protein